MTPEQRRLQAIVAALSRHSPNSRELLKARQDYLASQVEAHAIQVVAHIFNLRPDQRARIAAILRSVVNDESAAAA